MSVEQFEFFDIANPCIGVCENGPNGLCKGCFRKREERQYWNSLNNDVKRQIVQVCQVRKRRAQHKGKAGDEVVDQPFQGDLF